MTRAGVGRLRVGRSDARKDRVRWRVWAVVSKLPWVCPANAHNRIIWRNRDRTINVDAACVSDFERNGSCWCGKFRTEADA